MPESARRQGAAVLALLAAGGLAGCAHAPPPTSGADFRGALAALPEVNRAPRQLHGHPVLVQFFATWCFPCLAAFPALGEIARKDHPRGLEVVAVGMDLEGATVLEPFVAQYQPEFPVLAADQALREGKTAFGHLAELPVTVVLDAQGNVATAFSGVADAEQLQERVEPVLK